MKEVVAEYDEGLRGKQNVPNFSHGRRMLCADGAPTGTQPRDVTAVVTVIHPQPGTAPQNSDHLQDRVRS
jgi:hypothetical protein